MVGEHRRRLSSLVVVLEDDDDRNEDCVPENVPGVAWIRDAWKEIESSNCDDDERTSGTGACA